MLRRPSRPWTSRGSARAPEAQCSDGRRVQPRLNAQMAVALTWNHIAARIPALPRAVSGGGGGNLGSARVRAG